MAKTNKGYNEESGNLIDIKKLGDEHAALAKKLGYKERCSVNNVIRGREHELTTIKVCRIVAGVLAVATLGFAVAAFVGDEERRTRLLEIAGFIVIWVVLVLVYASRARNRIGEYELLEKVVREKTGR